MLPDQMISPAMQTGQKNDPPGAPVGPYGHGEGGLFNLRESSDAVFSAMMMPISGALGVIPVFRRDPLDTGGSDMFGGEMATFDTLMTGVTAGDLDDFDNQPTTDCADGPVGGLMKLCTVVNPYGRYRAGVREVSQYRAGQRADKLDPVTMRFLNSPPMQALLGVPSNTPSLQATLANEVARRMFESAVSFRRMFAPRVWIGSPANNNGEARDIVGLDTHINAGNKIDLQSSAICSAADSYIMNFDYEKITGGGRSIVEYMEQADYYTVEWNGTQMGLTPIDGWIFMRPETWRDVSAIWPIEKYYQALNDMEVWTNGRVVVNASDALRDRETFRATRVLPINSRNYQVVLDDTIPFKYNLTSNRLQPGQYSSDIFFVPRTVMGSVPVTFFEYFDHSNTQADTIQQLAGGNLTFTTDGGLFRWYVNFKNGCLRLNYEFSPRLKVKTPMVAWRITNVTSQPFEHVRSWDPASSYFKDGGNTSTAGRKYYTPWSPTTPVSVNS